MTDGPALIDVDRLLPYLQAHLLVTVAVSSRQSSLWLQGAPSCLHRAPCKGVVVCAFGFSLGSPYTISCWLATIVRAGSIKFTRNSWWGSFVGKYWDTSLKRTLTCITALKSHLTVEEAFHPQQVYLCAAPLLFVFKFLEVESSMDYKH